MARIKVSGPILPINITMLIINLPQVVRNPVIPKDKPTVPPADITSKKIVRNDCSVSNLIITKIKILVIKIEKKVRAIALTTIGPGIVLSSIRTCLSPFRVEIIY